MPPQATDNTQSPATPQYAPDEQKLLDTLRSSTNLTDDQRQGMWNAYHTKGDDQAFIGSLRNLDVNDDVRQSLWNLKKYGDYSKPTQAPTPAVPKAPTTQAATPTLQEGPSQQPGFLDNLRTMITGDVNTNRNLSEVMAEKNASAAAKGSEYDTARLAAINKLKSQRIVKYGETSSFDPAVQTHDAAIDAQIERLQDPSELNMWSDLNISPISPEALSQTPVVHGALRFAGSLAAPANIGLAGGSNLAGEASQEVGQIAQRAAGAGFSAQMMHGAGKGLAQGYVDIKQGNYKQAADEMTEALLGGAFAYLGINSTIHGESEPKPTQTPKTISPMEVSPLVAPRPPLNAPEPVQAHPQVETIDGMQPVPRKIGAGTSAVYLPQEAPKTHLPEQIEAHTSEIARLQSVLDNPQAPPDQKAYAQQAMQASTDLRAQLLSPTDVEQPKSRFATTETPAAPSPTNIHVPADVAPELASDRASLSPIHEDAAKVAEHAIDQPTAGVSPQEASLRQMVESQGGKYHGLDDLGLVHYDIPPDMVGGKEGVSVATFAKAMTPEKVQAEFARKAQEFAPAIASENAPQPAPTVASPQSQPGPAPQVPKEVQVQSAFNSLQSSFDVLSKYKNLADAATTDAQKVSIAASRERAVNAARDNLRGVIRHYPPDVLSAVREQLRSESVRNKAQADSIKTLADAHERNQTDVATLREEMASGGPVRKNPETGELMKPLSPVKRSARDLLHELMGEKSFTTVEDLIPNEKPANVPQAAWDSLTGKLLKQRTALRADIMRDFEIRNTMDESMRPPIEESGIMDKLSKLSEVENILGKYPEATSGRRQKTAIELGSNGEIKNNAPLQTITKKMADQIFGRNLRKIPEMSEFRQLAGQKAEMARLHDIAGSAMDKVLNPLKKAVADTQGQAAAEKALSPIVGEPRYVQTSVHQEQNLVGAEQHTVSLKDASGKEIGTAMLRVAEGNGERRLQVAISQIDASEQGKGYGKQMYRDIISYARDHGFDRVESDTNRTDPANGVWESLRKSGIPVEKIGNKGINRYSIDLHESFDPQKGAISPDMAQRMGGAGIGAAVGGAIGHAPGAVAGGALGFISPDLMKSAPVRAAYAKMQPALKAFGISARDWMMGPPQMGPINPDMKDIISKQKAEIMSPKISLSERLAQFPADVQTKLLDKMHFVNDNPGAITNLIRRLTNDKRGEYFHDLKGKLSVDESPYVSAWLAAGGGNGPQVAHLMGYQAIISDAQKAGLMDVTREYLNLKGYQRVYDVLHERAVQHFADIKNAKAALADPKLSLRDRVQIEDQLKDSQQKLDDIARKTASGDATPRGYNPQKIQADMTQLQQSLSPQQLQSIKGFADRVFAQNRKILDMLHDNGIVSDRDYSTYTSRGPEYIPMHRILDDLTPNTERWQMQGTKSPLYLRQQNVIRALTGSDKVNRDPFIASADANLEGIKEVIRNGVIKDFVSLGKKDPTGVGQYFQEVGSGYKAGPDESLVGLYEKGQPITYAVPRWLGETLQNSSPISTNVAGNAMMRFASTLFKKSITMGNPAFFPVRVARDLQEASLYSKGGIRLTNLGPDAARMVTGWVANVKDSLAKSPAWADYMNSGAAFSSMQRNITPENFLSLDKLGYTQKLHNRIVDTVASANAAAEDAIKMTTYQNLRQRGYSAKAAAWETRRYGGAPDYARSGSMTPTANLYFMFVNAHLQDIARVFARSAEDPKRMIGALGAVTMLAMTATMWNQQQKDENGKPIMRLVPNGDRDRNFVVLTGGTYRANDGSERANYIKIPKPPALRFITNPLEDMLYKSAGQIDKTGTQIGLDAISTLSPLETGLQQGHITGSIARGVVASSNPLLRVGAEEMMNYNTQGEGRPIVSAKQQTLDQSAQYGPNTWPVAKAIGQGGARGAEVGAATGAGLGYLFGGPAGAGVGTAAGAGIGAIGVSPARVEHTLQGTVAGIGTEVIRLSNSAIDTAKQFSAKSEAIRQAPVAGQVVSRFYGGGIDQEGKNAESTFYNSVQQSTQALATYKQYLKEDPTGMQAQAYMKANTDAIWTGRIASKMAEKIGKINKMQQLLEQDPVKNQKALQQLYDGKLQILQAFNRALNTSTTKSQPVQQGTSSR